MQHANATSRRQRLDCASEWPGPHGQIHTVTSTADNSPGEGTRAESRKMLCLWVKTRGHDKGSLGGHSLYTHWGGSLLDPVVEAVVRSDRRTGRGPDVVMNIL